jgi:hypothetical protein
MEFILDLRTVSEANLHEHWAKRHSRHSEQKYKIQLLFMIEQPVIHLPCIIKLTRVAPRALDEDNLIYSFKYIRDYIADQIFPGQKPGRADSDPRLKWEYSQEKSKPRYYAVKVCFSSTNQPQFSIPQTSS